MVAVVSNHLERFWTDLDKAARRWRLGDGELAAAVDGPFHLYAMFHDIASGNRHVFLGSHTGIDGQIQHGTVSFPGFGNLKIFGVRQVVCCP
ncbi:hypothetical protein D3C80_1750310 [compost metagenome]